jgi:hypothetical protein
MTAMPCVFKSVAARSASAWPGTGFEVHTSEGSVDGVALAEADGLLGVGVVLA